MTAEPPCVLCVDDDPRMLQILSKILSRLPVTFAAAERPDEALDLARRLSPRLLILDLMLPGMSGWETLDRIRERLPLHPLKVLVLTATDAGYDRLIAANVARVDAVMSKPFDADELARQVLRLLDLAPKDGWPEPRP